MATGTTVQLNIGIVSFPLEINTKPQPSAQTVNSIAELLKLGTFFHTRADFTPQQIALSELKSWLENNGYSVPHGLSAIISDTISINYIGIAANGTLDFSFAVTFNPPLGSGTIGGIVDIENIGLSIARNQF